MQQRSARIFRAIQCNQRRFEVVLVAPSISSSSIQTHAIVLEVILVMYKLLHILAAPNQKEINSSKI